MKTQVNCDIRQNSIKTIAKISIKNGNDNKTVE